MNSAWRARRPRQTSIISMTFLWAALPSHAPASRAQLAEREGWNLRTGTCTGGGGAANGYTRGEARTSTPVSQRECAAACDAEAACISYEFGAGICTVFGQVSSVPNGWTANDVLAFAINGFTTSVGVHGRPIDMAALELARVVCVTPCGSNHSVHKAAGRSLKTCDSITLQEPARRQLTWPIATPCPSDVADCDNAGACGVCLMLVPPDHSSCKTSAWHCSSGKTLPIGQTCVARLTSMSSKATCGTNPAVRLPAARTLTRPLHAHLMPTSRPTHARRTHPAHPRHARRPVYP